MIRKPEPKLSVSDVVKLFTNVPSTFVDDFFEMYKPDTKQDEFVINIENYCSKNTLLFIEGYRILQVEIIKNIWVILNKIRTHKNR